MTNESPPEDWIPRQAANQLDETACPFLPKRTKSASEIQDKIDADKGTGIASALRTHVNADVLPRRAS